jgi:hypothetical protein
MATKKLVDRWQVLMLILDKKPERFWFHDTNMHNGQQYGM